MEKVNKFIITMLFLNIIGFEIFASNVLSDEVKAEYSKLSADQKNKIRNYFLANYEYLDAKEKADKSETGDEYWENFNKMGSLTGKGPTENSPTGQYYILAKEKLAPLINKINLAVGKSENPLKSFRDVYLQLENL